MLPTLSDTQKKLVAGLGAALVFVLISLAVADAPAWQDPGQGGAEDFDTLVESLFNEHVIALEVLGILLTAAMIGAMVIARPMDDGEDTDAYPRVDDDHIEDAQQLANEGAVFATLDLEEE